MKANKQQKAKLQALERVTKIVRSETRGLQLQRKLEREVEKLCSTGHSQADARQLFGTLFRLRQRLASKDFHHRLRQATKQATNRGRTKDEVAQDRADQEKVSQERVAKLELSDQTLLWLQRRLANVQAKRQAAGLPTTLPEAG